MTTVKLTYFKPSGKFYADGEYETTANHLAMVCDEVREKMRAQTLPGLIKGHSAFDVLVEFDEMPALIRAAGAA